MSDKMSSSPTEHYGAIAVIVVLIVMLYHHSEDGWYRWSTLLLYIDNQEVVDRGNRKNPNFLNIGQYLTLDFDLWMVLSHLQMHLSL
jgi:hypothetical protein